MSRRIKERPVGTIFKRYNKQLKVVPDHKNGISCSLCVFCGSICPHSKTHCSEHFRKDKINIHYEKIKD